MKENLLLIFNLGTGDNFTMYAMVLHFLGKYKTVNILSLHRNYKMLMQLYENMPVVIHKLDESHNSAFAGVSNVDKYINIVPNCDMVMVGGLNGTYPLAKGDFYEKFYDQADLDYKMRYNYPNINRKKDIEMNLYKKLIDRYGKEYIFLHDHRNNFYKHYDCRKNVNIKSDIPIFHPNFNYYENDGDNKYYDLWDESLYSDNILDYCTIMENATEIHVNDSAFSALCPFLCLDNVKSKNIYTNITNLPNYHECFTKWNIKK